MMVASLGFEPRNDGVKVHCVTASPRGSARKEMYTLFPMRTVYHVLGYVSIRGGNRVRKGVLPLVGKRNLLTGGMCYDIIIL